MKDELKVTKISNGTVLDHLPPGSALSILDILDLNTSYPVIVAINVESSKYGKKDIIKIESVFLSKEETDEISLIAPNATINIIKNGIIEDKRKAKIPERLEGLLVCPNKKCITNFEKCRTRFLRESSKYRCYFCERLFKIEEFKFS